ISSRGMRPSDGHGQNAIPSLARSAYDRIFRKPPAPAFRPRVPFYASDELRLLLLTVRDALPSTVSHFLCASLDSVHTNAYQSPHVLPRQHPVLQESWQPTPPRDSA